MNRKRVFVQVKNQATGRWHNAKSAATYEEAVAMMKEFSVKYPESILRVLDKNLVTHTK